MEHKTVTIPIDEQFQEKIAELIKEGWLPTPGCQPVAVYHLTRNPMVEGLGFGGFGIDETKITVIKGANGNG